jgi:energy-coupling factor transporter ATP-binding protein EcfA2
MDSAAAERPPLLEIEHVSFRYGLFPVLSDVSLAIREGDFLAIIGPNGSGKTTLLKIILGLLAPESGRILFQGRSAPRARTGRRSGTSPRRRPILIRFFPRPSAKWCPWPSSPRGRPAEAVAVRRRPSGAPWKSSALRT